MKTRLTLIALAVSSAHVHANNTFSESYFFGDSQTDSGYFAAATTRIANPSGKFTTNPDKVWSENVAEHYGTSAKSVSQNGTNYAVSGALAGTDTTNAALGNVPVPSTQTQVANYLKKHNGQADGNALYGMTSGANNLLATQADPANATALLTIAAKQTATAINQLADAGANYIIVPNVPDVGLSPAMIAQGAAAQKVATTATAGYNTLLYTELAQSHANVIPINMFELVQEVAANPSQYGFDNIHQAACTTSNALLCNTNTLTTENANKTYFFADSLHPSGGGHALIGDYAISVLEAPTQIGRVVDDLAQQSVQKQNDLYRKMNTLPENEHGFWVDSTTHKYSNLVSDGESLPTLSLGTSFSHGNGHTGVYVEGGVQKHNWNNDAGSHELQSVGGGVFHRQNFGKARVNAQFGYEHLKLDISRTVKLGTATRRHQANADGYRMSVGVRGGYRFSALNDKLAFEPYLSANAQRLQIGQLSEDQSSLSTAMLFSKIKRESVNGEVGVNAEWRFLPNTSFSGSLNFSHNFLKPEKNVSARLSTMPLLVFDVPADKVGRNLTSASLGVKQVFAGGNLNVGVSGYRGSNKTKGMNLYMGVTHTF